MEKFDKVSRRRYLLTVGITIKSYIKYFTVPKGEDDIQMVYDTTNNKLNEVVWVPTFWLPTIDLPVQNIRCNSWMTDRDVGDVFLNYQLQEDVCPHMGIDFLCLYKGPMKASPRWVVQDRNLMGFVALPYNSIKMALVAEEEWKGNRFKMGVGCDGKELNPFKWKQSS